jgi:hypothetical protein
MKMIAKALLASALALASVPASAATFYTDGATDFTGQYRGVGAVDAATHSWGSAAGSAAISFDLFGARSVDGVNGFQDLFTVAVNGIDVFAGSFNMSGGGANLVSLNTFGWMATTTTNGTGGFFEGGVTTVTGFVNLIAGLNTFTVTFSNIAAGNQGTGDESWALNNLAVASVPVPPALPLLAVGLMGLGLVASRKRKA